MPEPLRDLPPRVPDDLAELVEATMLLGNFGHHGRSLRASRQDRLRALLGDLPRSKAECAAWKTAIKGYRRELSEMDKDTPHA